MRKLIKSILVAAGATALLLPATPAHAASTLNGCFASPGNPYTYYSSTGVLRVAASIYVDCQTGRGGTFTLAKQIREDDVTNDDTLASSNELVTVEAGTTRRFVISTTCKNNESGVEEVYARGKLSTYYASTDWRRGNTVSLYC